jgi:Peptidase family M48
MRTRHADSPADMPLRAPNRWIPPAALFAFYAYLSIHYLITDGLEDLRADLPDLAFDIGFHVALARLLTPAVLLLVVGAPALWSGRTRALRAVRLAPSPALITAAAGLVPLDRLFLLADDHPFAACIGLWRPAIYVSAGLARRASPAALRAALAHEEAHRRRRDPARLLALRIVTAAITPLPWLAAAMECVALRAEIQADRFARTRTSTPSLAEALLTVLRGGPHTSLTGASLTGATVATGAASSLTPLETQTLSMRLRYLRLPDNAPLPPLLPTGMTLTRALQPLAHTLPYGITGRRGGPYLFAVAFLLVWADMLTP